jgi:hypothetical protein
MKLLRRIMGTVILTATILPVFSQVDTSGIGSWKAMHNSTASWEEGAFGANATGHPDYGWGIYNMITHGLTGDSLYVLKLQDGSYRRLWIVGKDGVQNYTFKYAMLDGSSEQEVVLSTNDYVNKQFVHYSLAGDSVVDQQPPASDWDLLLTKFHHNEMDYVVTGFLANDGVTVSVFHAADSATAAAATLADTTEFTDSIAAIGNSWYVLKGMSMVPLDTMVYFVKTASGDISKLQVTFFESGMSGLGRVGIRKQLLTGTADTVFIPDTLVMGFMYANEVFYSLGTKTAVAVPRNTWDIGFKTGPYTSSINANTGAGVVVWTYPNGDITAWGPAEGINPVGSTPAIKVYPVPADNELFIRHEFNTREPLDISLFDLSGRLIRKYRTGSGDYPEIRIGLNGIQPGIYVLLMENREIRAESKISIK